MNLNIEEWKEFLLKDVFEIKYGVNLELNACEENDEKDSINFVSRTESNNGISAKIKKLDEVETQEAGLITIAGGGSVLSTFVQPEEFYSGRDLYTLKAKAKISDEAKQFIVTVIKANKYKYNYGRQANKTLPYLTLKLPIKHNLDGTIFIDETCKYSLNGYVPDWQYMEDYIKSLHYKPLTTKNKIEDSLNLKNISEWKNFKIETIFPKNKIKHFSATPEEIGDKPYISSTSVNNGVAAYVNENTIPGNCITVSTNGDCFDCFYQPEEIVASSDVEVLYAKELNKYTGLFIATILKLEKAKYNYGRKPKNNRVYDTIIKLPAVFTGSTLCREDGYAPDWQYMEDYIKSLPFGDKL